MKQPHAGEVWLRHATKKTLPTAVTVTAVSHGWVFFRNGVRSKAKPPNQSTLLTSWAKEFDRQATEDTLVDDEYRHPRATLEQGNVKCGLCGSKSFYKKDKKLRPDGIEVFSLECKSCRSKMTIGILDDCVLDSDELEYLVIVREPVTIDAREVSQLRVAWTRLASVKATKEVRKALEFLEVAMCRSGILPDDDD